ncbi:pca operon transcription factor PcaQ [Chromohalobacter israelensis]|uniref:pca operon transcription factor PcaQ n=2 Tax=Chromohalobacter TaxID=42054 RepID=UPI00240B9CA2|nr:pca operon transcription factor PcaQ [Chromohalobacter israelensis]MDF9434901.1 pca operon transcription factor PcaQ [Chromohalobacter israelensis]
MARTCVAPLPVIREETAMLSARVKLRHLMAFQEVARLQSLAKAAQALSITQPAMSKTIRELEEILETTLFERSPQGATLTTAGLTLLRHAGPALRSLGEGFQAVRDAAQQEAVVRLGALSTVEEGLLPRALHRLHAQAPQWRVQVVTGPSAYLLSRLRMGELDAVAGRMSEAREIRGLQFEHLYYEPLVLVVRAGHPLLGQDVLDAEALIANAWIVPPTSTTLRDQVERFWVEQGAAPPRIALETLSLSLSRRYALASDALWVAPLDAVREDLRDGRLARLPVRLESRGGSVGVCTNIALPRNPGVDALSACLRDIVAEMASPST